MRDNKVIAAAVLIIALTLALAIGGAWLIGLKAGETATKNAVNITQLCQAGNEARAQQVGLWEYVATISRPPPHETPTEQRAREATIRLFIAHVRHVFAKRDCAHPDRTEAP